MRRVLRLGFGLAFFAGTPAFAADLPSTKAPPLPPPPAFTWTGFYVDGGAGYGEWAADTTTRLPGSANCALCIDQIQGGRGLLGRAGAGFDYQFAERFVAGVFADGTYAGMRGAVQDQAAGLTGNNITQTWSWAAGVRLGMLVTPDLLAYANAGFTQSHFTGSDLVRTTDGAESGNSIASFNPDGWFVGGGLETMVAPGWFWRSEYRMADYGTQTLADSGAAGRLDDIRFRPIVQTVTTSLVYKLGWPGMNPPAFPGLGFGNLFSDLITPATGPSIWNGAYIDAGAGYGVWSANTVTRLPNDLVCVACIDQRQGGRGVGGRIGFGYDYQLTGKIVAGAFGDFDPAGLSGTIQDQTAGLTGTIVQHWSWGGGARLGFLVTPQILSYSKFGFTQAHFDGTALLNSANGIPSGLSTQGFTSSGWLLGDGIEAQFAPGWFWNVEYRYAQYEAHDIASYSAGGPGNTIHFHPEMQSGVAGLVYKFNWSPTAPVEAKY